MRIYIYAFLLLILVFTVQIKAQINPLEAYPDLFDAVQTQRIFKDQKTFPDCRPLFAPDSMVKLYHTQKQLPDFNLKEFVGRYFDTLFVDTMAVFKHIDRLWESFIRFPENTDSLSSLIALPYPYVVPGGRFREVYYWDTYFTMLGLQAAGKTKIIEHMVNNFAYLIDRYGFIPNGNRTYYLSRSQPPFFSLMVDLLAESNEDTVYRHYLPYLDKEYQFWMEGSDSIKEAFSAKRKVVCLKKKEILNRYWDNSARPRPESYLHDQLIYEKSNRNKEVYRDMRSAAESGWDFSSRWFKDGKTLESISTTGIIPVDLNCLLYHLEKTLEKGYRLSKQQQQAKLMESAANIRKNLLLTYCWNADSGYFYDYNYTEQQQTGRASLAGIYPLFFHMVDTHIAKLSLQKLKSSFLCQGGLVTTNYHTGQQWDYPNGWAPLQWIGYKACKNYGDNHLANEIAVRWTNLNCKVFFETGKMLEKYNVINIHIPGGGGEYPLQDGFGWTNGVFLKLWMEERKTICMTN